MTQTRNVWLPALFIFSLLGAKAQATPTGFIAYAYDYQIAGCAYDTANPSAKIQVHVYPESGVAGVVGIAGYACPWNSSSAYQGHGFIIQFRRPVNSPANVNVAMLDSNNANPVWISTNSAQHQVNNFNRAVETLQYNTPWYKIGISRKFGAAVSEFYNNRVDNTVNLVMNDPGAMVQTALFGTSSTPAFGGASNCVGSADTRYNPTQSGTHCATSGSVNYGSVVDMCTSSGSNALCTATSVNDTAPSDSNPAWVQFRVHYRNFYNAAGYNGTYQPYEDVYGWVKYSFKATLVQVDYQMWKTNATTYGSTFQQMPIAFLTQLSKVTTAQGSIIRNPSTTLDYSSPTEPGMSYGIGSGYGRWFLAEAVNNRPSVPLAAPGDFLTVAAYSAVVNGSGSTCPSRSFETNFEGAGASGPNNWVGVQQGLHVQNFSNFTPAMFNYEQSRALLIPFRPSEGYGGGALFSDKIATLESSGGWMPAWECNQ